MGNLAGGNGYSYKCFTANTAGFQLGVVGADAASKASAAAISGFLHSISWGSDSSAWQIVVYDGTDTTGTVIAKISGVATGAPGGCVLDCQATRGLFVVITGTGTSAGLTFTYA